MIHSRSDALTMWDELNEKKIELNEMESDLNESKRLVDEKDREPHEINQLISDLRKQLNAASI